VPCKLGTPTDACGEEKYLSSAGRLALLICFTFSAQFPPKGMVQSARNSTSLSSTSYTSNTATQSLQETGFKRV